MHHHVKGLWCQYVLILVILTLITQLTLCLPCFSTMNEIVKDRLFGVWLFFFCQYNIKILRFNHILAGIIYSLALLWRVHSVNVTPFPLPLGEVGDISISLSIAYSTIGVGPLSTVVQCMTCAAGHGKLWFKDYQNHNLGPLFSLPQQILLHNLIWKLRLKPMLPHGSMVQCLCS